MEGRVAIISGASRGIGAATAKALAAQGCDIVVNYEKNRDAAEAVKAAVETLGRRAIVVQGSIDAAGTGARLVAAAIDAFQRLDIVVNNAGITAAGHALHDSEVAEVERQFRVHALGSFALTKAAIPHLLKQPRGDVIYISSTAAKKLMIGVGPYAMAKAAGEAMAVIMAKELSRLGIHVNIVAPGMTATDMALGDKLHDADALAELDATMPFGHVCRPEEVAHAVAFFCSAGSYASGERLYLDGARGP